MPCVIRATVSVSYFALSSISNKATRYNTSSTCTLAFTTEAREADVRRFGFDTERRVADPVKHSLVTHSPREEEEGEDGLVDACEAIRRRRETKGEGQRPKYCTWRYFKPPGPGQSIGNGVRPGHRKGVKNK